MAGIPPLSGTTQEGKAPLVTAVLRQLGSDSGLPNKASK
jgi:hypothetical protein